MVYAIFMLADQYTQGSNIVICELEKYRTGRQINYTYSILDNMINSEEPSERNEYRATMTLPSSPVDLLSETKLYRMEPLALVYLSNPLDNDGFMINDVRTYGGGYKKPRYSCYDNSLYDGERIDLSAKIHFTVPKWIYNDLRARALEFDEDISHLSDKEHRVDGLLHSKLTALFEKYSQLGTDISYEVVE